MAKRRPQKKEDKAISDQKAADQATKEWNEAVRRLLTAPIKRPGYYDEMFRDNRRK